MGLLKSYIIYMVMVTLHSVVTMRQYQMRSIFNDQNKAIPKVLFPRIKREDAEKNLKGMIKYLFNYGFYKFGMEITMITLVSTIAYRQDIFAVVYTFWLVFLMWLGRSRSARIWGVFQLFILVTIILQYVLLIGMPPELCISTLNYIIIC